MKKLLFKYIGIAAAVLFSLSLGEIVSRTIIMYKRDIYVNKLIGRYQPRYPSITQKNLISAELTSKWWNTYIHLTFEDATAEIDITAQLYVFDVGES